MSLDDAKVVEKREGQEKGEIEYYMHYIGCNYHLIFDIF